MRRACVILAGGAGRRMGGADKAALLVGGVTLLDRVLRVAAPVCGRLVVVGPPRTTEVVDVVFTTEERPGGGPVPAVLAGLDAAGRPDIVLVLAVDQPLLSTVALERLVEPVSAGRAGAAAAQDDRGHPNALLAAYRADVLEAARRTLGDDAPSSPAACLLPTDVVVVELDRREILNVNTPADLARARRRLDAAAP